MNSDLVDITTLYQDWAEPYQLWECKLAILQCAGLKVLSEQLNPCVFGVFLEILPRRNDLIQLNTPIPGHPDPMLVSNIWTKIIDQQVVQTSLNDQYHATLTLTGE